MWHCDYGVLRHTMWGCGGLTTVWGMCRQEGSSVEMDKDSSLCLACLDTVVIDNQDAAPLYAEVWSSHVLRSRDCKSLPAVAA